MSFFILIFRQTEEDGRKFYWKLILWFHHEREAALMFLALKINIECIRAVNWSIIRAYGIVICAFIRLLVYRWRRWCFVAFPPSSVRWAIVVWVGFFPVAADRSSLWLWCMLPFQPAWPLFLHPFFGWLRCNFVAWSPARCFVHFSL